MTMGFLKPVGGHGDGSRHASIRVDMLTHVASELHLDSV
jgi:hypothetical protein